MNELFFEYILNIWIMDSHPLALLPNATCYTYIGSSHEDSVYRILTLT